MIGLLLRMGRECSHGPLLVWRDRQGSQQTRITRCGRHLDSVRTVSRRLISPNGSAFRGERSRMRTMSRLDVTVHRTGELDASLRGAWHRAMDESPEYANPFLSPEFAIGVGRHRGGARVAVLREGGEPVGFLPFERNALGVGRAIGLGLSDCQALVHRPGVTWDSDELLRACGLSIFEFDHLVEEQKPFV